MPGMPVMAPISEPMAFGAYLPICWEKVGLAAAARTAAPAPPLPPE